MAGAQGSETAHPRGVLDGEPQQRAPSAEALLDSLVAISSSRDLRRALDCSGRRHW